jgi:hypothetical protein
MAVGERGVTLPIAAGIGAVMPDVLRQRDQYLERTGQVQERPRCLVCGQELAVPYRESGVHPECRDIAAASELPKS